MSTPENPNVVAAEEAHTKSSHRVVIVGGGIAGLSTAWYLQKLAVEYALQLECTVLEASTRWGGKLKTTIVEQADDKPFIFEDGADAFLTRKPWAYELAVELGLETDMIGVNELPQRIYVLNNGKLVPMPEGVYLLVPTKLRPFLRSPLFSVWGKFRMLIEYLLPRGKVEGDESIKAFVTRRFGREAADKLAEPLLSGVYNADIGKQSILATFPQYRQLEATHGSLIRGMTQHKPTSTGNTSRPTFISFKRGTAYLVTALVQQLQATLATQQPVERIAATDNGYVLATPTATYHADTVVMATPADVSSRLLADVAPNTATQLQAIQHEGVGTMSLVYEAAAVNRPLDAYGVVIPSHEGRQIDGMTWTTSKWDGRAPKDHIVIRIFFGGPATRSMLAHDDDALLHTIRAELADILDIQAEPLQHHIQRWPHAYPQYDVGHVERVAAIESSLPTQLYVTGSAYHGVGVPDCVRGGKQTAERIIETIREKDHG